MPHNPMLETNDPAMPEPPGIRSYHAETSTLLLGRLAIKAFHPEYITWQRRSQQDTCDHTYATAAQSYGGLVQASNQTKPINLQPG